MYESNRYSGFRPANDIRGRNRTRMPGDFPAVLKDDHGRNAADSVAGRDPRTLLGVEPGGSEAGLQLGGRPFEFRRHGPTGSAPGRPEIDHHWQTAANRGLEGRLRQVRRSADKDRLPATPTGWPVVESRPRYPVSGSAGGTPSNDRRGLFGRHGLGNLLR